MDGQNGNGTATQDHDIKALQEDTVSALLAERKVFTAYDITSSIRAQSIQTPKHDDMKEVVHAMFHDGRMSDYDRTLVHFQSAPSPCWLYHPPEVDPKNYAAGMTQQAQTATISADVQADADSLAAPATSNADGSVSKTIGNLPGSVLYIPRDFAQKANIAARGDAFMAVDPLQNKIVVSSATTPDKTHVDRNQNIRIGKTALLKAGLDGKVEIRIDGQEIIISKANN